MMFQKLVLSVFIVSRWTSAITAFVQPAVRAPLQSLQTSTSLEMANKLWDRLCIEEDPEPFWYLINCVATNEIDLLRQCRSVCEDMPDAVKFVVPLEQKTRSHGANKMVTETKVKYPGYVFGKLRLCPEVYEVIQNLDLCRSWMGTVNHKGHKKLPPAPVALNELEVENFGLEELDAKESDEILGEPGEDEKGIILDSEEDDDDDDLYDDPMYKNIDKKALKLFMGLKVDDMVKVTAQNKFHKEDGIVRRLKEGKIFVRFYTYGTMFEEWLDPSDVRKLTSEEVVDGLTGPAQPITQRDFDEPEVSSFGGRYGGNSRPGQLRNSLTGAMRGAPRERRQDRTADRFRQDSRAEQRRNDKNWDWFKNQRKQQGTESFTDDQWTMRPGSQPTKQSGADFAQGDVDSQWGRKPQRQQRRETRRAPRHQIENRQIQNAIDGNADWSSFVSSTDPKRSKGADSQNGGSDDFFASLVTDLDKDLTAPSNNGRRQQQGQQNQQSTFQKPDDSSEDDFFASLMTELSDQQGSSKDDSIPESKTSAREMPNGQTAKQNDIFEVSQDDDFFAALEAELGTDLNRDVLPNEENGEPTPSVDDFFADLEKELGPPAETSTSTTKPSPKKRKTASTGSDLSKNTVPVLKDMLRERGLKVGGKKAELVERLLNST